MLSSSPAVPISSFTFPDQHRRRLALVTEHGKELFTAHDGLPSPEHLTPISGTPHSSVTPNDGSPTGSDTGSAAVSRKGSESYISGGGGGGGRGGGVSGDGTSLRKVPSRGGLWHDEVGVKWLSFRPICRIGVLFYPLHSWLSSCA